MAVLLKDDIDNPQAVWRASSCIPSPRTNEARASPRSQWTTASF